MNGHSVQRHTKNVSGQTEATCEWKRSARKGPSAATRSFRCNKNSTRITSVSSVGANKLQNGGAMPSKSVV
eukprot:scaffold158434_cov51-Attheya_sp.AAC.3